MKKKMRVIAMILAAALCVSSTPFSVSADEMETEVVTESAADEVENISAENAEQVEDVEVDVKDKAETVREIDAEDEAGIKEEMDVEVEVEAEEETDSKDASMATIVDSGTCGENLTWTLDDEGTLIISGSGEMEDYDNNSSPFFDKSNIKKIIVNDGVTNIGNNVFRRCSSLTSITISNSVTSIGEYAFHCCSNLTYITIPNSITSIRIGAFRECSKLTRITIPNSVTSIEGSAFYECSSLTSIIISDSVRNIGWNAFQGCSSLTSIRIPNSITTIAESAFSFCSSLTSITIPNNVKNIGGWAFCGCSGLTNITIPNSVTEIGDWAFNGCSSLASITIPSSVVSIGRGAFLDCCSLTDIYLDASNSVFTTNDNVLYDKNMTTLICCPGGKSGFFSIPSSITKIEEYAFQGCSNLTGITIPNSITRIENWTFVGCSGLTSITIPNSVTSMGWNAFQGCSSLTSITIPNSVTSIESCTFYGCNNLENIIIPNSVKGIGDSTFNKCSKLKSIIIPKSVTSIGRWAFENCSSLKEVYYSGLEEEWDKIGIDQVGNDSLLSATIHFNSTGPVEIDVKVEEGPEISDMTYLAMSDAAYLKKMDSYKGKGVLGDKAKTIKTDDIRRYKLIFDHVCNNIPEEYGLTWGDVYKQCLSTWSVLDFTRDDNIGFHAVTFQRGDRIVIAYEGSGALNNYNALTTDWVIDDLGMAFRKDITPQMVPAINYAKRIINQYGDGCEISFTGHSLGGGLAILAANATNCEAVPFDSAPTVEAGYYLLWDYLGNAFKGIDKWTYTDIVNQNCPVGLYEKNKKNHKGIRTQYKGVSLFVNHARETLIVFDEESSQFKLAEPISSLEKKFSTEDKYSVDVRHSLVPNLKGLPTEWIISSGTLKLGTSLNNKINGIPGFVHTDVIYGGEGVDWLNGYQGDDYLIGGPGDDKLDGNTGNDTYVCFKCQDRDTITDYQGNDVIKLYGFSDSDNIECENLNDSATHCCITCNGDRIINISKNRSLNPLNSFKVEVMDSAGNVKKEVKIQDWNTWKNVRTYKIACPVNVEIYDSDDNLVMTMEDGVEDTIYTEYGNFYSAFNEETNEYNKMVDLLSDYSIKIVGNNDGNMDVSVFETDETGKETEYGANDIAVSKQEVFVIDDDAKKVISDNQEVELTEVKTDTEDTGTDDNKEDAGEDKKDSTQNAGTNTGTTVTTKPAASGSASAAVSAPPASKLKKVKAGKKKATLKWKKVSGATGYEIQYGSKKNFKKAKTKTIKKAKTVKTTIKKLKAGKKYYFRIRTYKTVNGVKYYSAWSKAKKVKIK